MTPEDQLFPEDDEEQLAGAPMLVDDAPPPRRSASPITVQEFLSRHSLDRAGSNLEAAREASEKIPSDQAARILRLQTRTGLPADLIRANPDAIEREANRADFDADAFRRESPIVADWMAQSPEHASILQPDATRAQQLEDTLRSIWGVTRDLTLGRIQQEVDMYREFAAGAVEFPEMGLRGMGKQTEIAIRNLAVPMVPGVDRLTVSVGSGENEFTAPAIQIPSILMELGARPLQSVVDQIEVPEERKNYITDVSRGVGQLFSQVITALLTRGTVTFAGLWGMGVDMQSAQVEAAEARGIEVSDKNRDMALTLGGGATAITEKLGLDFLLDRLPPKARTMIGRWVGDIALAGGGEALQEMSEAALQNAITKLFADPSQNIIDAGTLYEGGVGFGAGAVGRALLNMAVPARRRRMSEQVKEKVGKLNQTIQDMELTGRAPEQLESLVDSIKQRTGMDAVWINLDGFNTFFQSQGLDPEKASADMLGDGGLAYREARATGGKIEIPVEKYARHIATNENAASLEASVAFAHDQMTADEASFWEREQEKIMEDFRKAMAGEEVSSDYQFAYDAHLGSLLNVLPQQTAERVARLRAAMDTNIAKRNSIPIQEFVSANPISFNREVPEAIKNLPRLADTGDGLGLDVLLDRLRAGDMPTERQAYGASVLDLLRQWGVRDEGGELSARDVNLERRPGQRNIARDDGITLDEARERLVELGFLQELPGNTPETGEQDVLDLVDREMGGQLQFGAGQGDQRAAQVREAMLGLENFLGQMNADPQELTNDEIAQIIQSGMPVMSVAEIAGQVLDQRVWHGSRTRHGGFSMDYVGTGEGFSAFGWGLYFAQAVHVANKYRVAGATEAFTYENAPERPGDQTLSKWQRTPDQVAYDDAVFLLQRNGIEQSLSKLRNTLAYWQSAYDDAVERGDLASVARYFGMVEHHKAREAVLVDFQENATETMTGHLYEVEISDQVVDSMLMWDRPWAEQPESVRKALEANGFRPRDLDTLTGEGVYFQVAAQLYAGNDFNLAQKIASEWLASIGILGNRFFDQDSRTKPMAERTENLVLFRAEDAEIVSIDGAPMTTSFNQSHTLRSGRETLKRFGLDPNKRHTTRAVAAALEARQRAKYGRISRTDRSPETARKIANWMVAEIEFEMTVPGSSGIGWYTEKFQSALNTMADVFPELATDQDARSTMTALIAVTSDGTTVVPNFRMAMGIYRGYRENGKFALRTGGHRAASVRNNLKILTRLYEERGVAGAHEYLMAEMTVKELNALARQAGATVSSDYTADMTVPAAAMEFGPKLGAFYANLMGSQGYLTMDLWWSRTFNRYRGDLLTKPTKEGLARFRELLGQPDLSADETVAATVSYERAYRDRNYQTRLALLVGRPEPTKKKEREKWLADAQAAAGNLFGEMHAEHETERAANTIYKAAFKGLNEAPFNASDRKFMVETVMKAHRTLKRKGYNFSIADIQAALWYYEKRLYGDLGARQTADISYDEAAIRVAAEFADGAAAAGDARPDRGDSAVGETELRPGEDDYLPEARVLEQTDADLAPPTWSDQFRNWFGNSVVVNETGEPLVVYHGSQRSITEFSTEGAEAGRGGGPIQNIGFFFSEPSFWFTSSGENASGYAEERYPQTWDIVEKATGEVRESLGSREEARTWLKTEFGEPEKFTVRRSPAPEPNVMPVFLKMENPLVVDAQGANWNDIAWTPAEQDRQTEPYDRTWEKDFFARRRMANQLQEGQTVSTQFLADFAQEAGYDGLIVRNVVDRIRSDDEGAMPAADTFVIFEGTQVKSAIGNTGAFDPQNPNVLFQGADERNLVARHNLTAENVRHALRIGGLPVPSISVMPVTTAFNNFGEITLIGPMDLVNPRQGAKVFGADVYSPRYPTVDYGIPDRVARKIVEGMPEAREGFTASAIAEMFQGDEVGRRGPTAFALQPLVMRQFLIERGITPNTVYRQTARGNAQILADARAVGLGEMIDALGGVDDHMDVPEKYGRWKMMKDPVFIRAAAEMQYLDWARHTRNASAAERKSVRGAILRQLTDPDMQGHNMLLRAWDRIFDAQRPPQVNAWETQQELNRQITGAGLTAEYSTWAAARWDALGVKERITTWSREGNKSFKPHTLRNVVNAMKRNVRAGEDPDGMMYGLGPLRAHFTPQFTSITRIQQEKGRIINEGLFEDVKLEMDSDFGELVAELTPYYSRRRVMDEALQLLADIPRMGVQRAWTENGFSGNFPAGSEVDSKIREFMERLRNMPTEYFEAIIPRAVELSEFAAAVLPTDTAADVVQALRDAGVAITMYRPSNNLDRHRAILQASRQADASVQVLFQNDAPAPFFSALEQGIINAPQDKATGPQWMGILKNRGVKSEELDWYELADWMGDRVVTRQELLEYFRANELTVAELPVMGPPLAGGREMPSDLNKIRDLEAEQEFKEAIESEGLDVTLTDNGHADWGSSLSYLLAIDTDTEAGQRMLDRMLENVMLEDLGEGLYGVAARPQRPSDSPYIMARVRADSREEAMRRGLQWVRDQLDGGVTPLAFDPQTQEEVFALLPLDIQKNYEWLHDNLADFEIEVQGTVLTDEWQGDPDEVPYENLTLPGGENYRILRFALRSGEWFGASRPSDTGVGIFDRSHLNDNLVYWMRVKDRIDSDGNRVFFIEEIQSDWHQKGRKFGYVRPGGPRAGSAVPDAPFKTTWQALALKRAVRFAAEGGYDKVAWTSGEEQKRRNSLGTYVSTLWAERDGDFWKLDYELYNRTTGQQRVPDAELEAYIGDDVARKVREREAAGEKVKGIVLGQQELTLGGAMHEQIYDRVLPRAAGKMFGKYGAKARQARLEDGAKHALPPNPVRTLTFDGMDVLNWTNWIDYIGEMIEDHPRADEIDPFAMRSTLSRAVMAAVNAVPGETENMTAFADAHISEQNRRMRDAILRYLDGEVYTRRLDDENRPEPASEDDVDPYLIMLDMLSNFVRTAPMNMVIAEGEAVYPTAWEMDVTDSLREAAMAGQPLFQKGSRKPRGRIEMRNRDEQGVRAFQVVLGEDANLSTVLHELGHYYFEIMADLAEMPSANDQVRNDYRLMLKFLGVDDRSQVTRAHHEKMARSFEAYLMEGKAPSVELASLFGRMRAWLISVYKEIRRLNAPLNDEIRGVFDRMIASDDAIAAANTAQALDPLFKDAAEAGMTEQEFADYQQARTAVEERAQVQVQTELMSVRVRESKAWWKRLREQTRRVVEREVNEQRVYQVLAYLQGGKNADGSALPEGQAAVKLDRQALVDTYGKDFIKRLPRPYIYAREGGADPELVAEMFGFDSADQMIQEILQARPKKQLIEAETEARMRETYPDPLLDGSLPVAARDAVMSDKQGEILLKELNALERRGGRQGQPTPLTVIRAAVERILASKPVRAVDPRRYQTFAAQAGRRAQQAMLTGDIETARVEKQRQLLNHELYRQAMSMREEVEKIRSYFQRLQKTSTRQRLGKAGASYLDQIDAITERYELARVSNQKLDRRRSLREFVDALEDDGQEVGIDPVILNEARRVNYRDVPVSELRSAYDAARQLEHFARLKLKFKTRREQANWKDVKRQLIDAARLLPQNRRPLDPNTIGWFKRAMSGVRDLDAAMLKMEQIVLWLDGERVDGPWHKFFFNEFADAQTAKLDLMRDRFAQLRTAIDSLADRTKTRLMDKVFMPSLGESVTRDFLVGFALNMGNASNRKKAIEGMKFNEVQVKEMLDQLTAEEWQLVQTIWDTFESLWPDIAALQKEMTGLEPAKIEATPVETKFGTLRGGYYPVVYDSDKSKAGMAQENERLKSSGPFATGYSFATTAKGHVKERVENFTAAMRFSLDVVPNRLARHIHDLTHRQAVVNAHRILTDPEIKAALQDALGIEIERSMYPWLKRQANDSAFDVLDGTSGFKRIMERLRMNTSIVAMGLKVTTMMSQFGGYFDAAEMVGAKWMAVGMGEYYRNPLAAGRFASEKSGEIRHRFELKDLTVREQLQRLQGKVDWRSKATRFYFMNILIADKMVATASWLGEYRKQIDAGASDANAVLAADAMIRLTQGAGGTKDLSAIQATENQLLRWMGMFYTYFNAKYNRIRSMGRRGKRVAKGEIDQLPMLMMQVWWGTFLPAVISEVLAGRGPGDDDDNWALWALQVWIEFPFMTVIGLRDIAGPVIQDVLPWRERPFPGRYQLTPVQQAGASMVRFGTTAAEGLQGEADLEEVMLRGFEAFGYMYGLPTSQAKITGRAILEMLEGDGPETTREAVRNLMFTPRD